MCFSLSETLFHLFFSIRCIFEKSFNTREKRKKHIAANAYKAQPLDTHFAIANMNIYS